MLMTFLTLTGVAAIAGEAALLVHGRYRKRKAWEPGFREMLRGRQTNWRWAGEAMMPLVEVERLTKDGLHKLDEYIWNTLAVSAGLKQWTEWSIDWRHGCLDIGGVRNEAGWHRPKDADYVFVHFYDSTVIRPPKPKPAPPPPAPALWTERDDLAQARSFLANPTAFWLAMDGKVPALRYYEDGSIVICQNGASTEPEHADLLYDDKKKRKFIVITDNAQDGWKKRGFTSLFNAEKAIADYFDQRRLSLKIFRNEVDAAEGRELRWDCGTQMTVEAVKVAGAASMYTLSTPDETYFFSSRREAIEQMKRLGYAMSDIVEMMGYQTVPDLLSKPYMRHDAVEVERDWMSKDRRAIQFSKYDIRNNRVDVRLRGERVQAYHYNPDGGLTVYLDHGNHVSMCNEIHEDGY